MRITVAVMAFTLAACGQPTQTTVSGPVAATQPEDAYAGWSGAGRVPEQPFTLESEAVVGLWSFQRDCGLYDLVFRADGSAHYFDYSADLNVSHSGSWTTAANNRVVLTLRRLDGAGIPSGPQLIYNLDVSARVTDDLVGRFGPADGAAAQDITARRCPQEQDSRD